MRQYNQPVGPTSVEPNKQAIARIFGLKKSQVDYIKIGLDLSTLSAVFEENSQWCFDTTNVTGTVSSFVLSSTNLNLTTTTGTYQLKKARPGDWISAKTLSLPVSGTVEDALDSIFTLSGLGVLTDGTDQTTQLQNAINTASLYGGVIDGRGHTVTVSSGLKIDLHKSGLRHVNIVYKYPNNVAPTNPVFVLSLDGTASTRANNWKMVLDRVRLEGVTARETAPVYGFLVNPSVNLANLKIENCGAIQFKSSIVFGSNSYLITFENFVTSRYNTALTDTQTIGYETTISNAGENIRFVGGVLSDGNNFGNFVGFEATINFYSTSFDYSGGPIGTSIIQWILSKQSLNLNFVDCHLESGNVNDGLSTYYFQANASVSVTFTGGWFVFGSTTYNDCPCFFYDATSGTATFSLDNVKIYGLGIKKWSNIKPEKFLPTINYSVSNVYSAISDRSGELIDQMFSMSTIPDPWYASGTRTSRIESDQVVLSTTTVDDGTGTSVSALKVSRKPSASNVIANLMVRRPNNAFGPSFRFKIKCDTALTLSSPINVTVALSKSSGTKDAYGVDTGNSEVTTWQTTVTQLTTSFVEVVARASLGRSQSYIGYDKVHLGININGLPSGTSDVYIRDVRVEQPE